MDHQNKEIPKGKSVKEKSNDTEESLTSEQGRERGKLRRPSPYLTTAALIKFSTLQKKRKSTGTTASKDSKNTDSLEGPYALGSIMIPALQRLNNIHFFLVLYCILVICQGTVFGLVDLSIGTFVKEHYLGKSAKLALMLTYDVSSCLVAVFVAYYGGRGSRTKWIAISALLVGLGSILFAIPNRYGLRFTPSEDVEDLCDEHKEIEDCPKSKRTFQSKFIHFFILGQALEGIGGMPIFILGMSFLDDSVPLHSSGIYLGVGEAAAIFGYGLGFAIGAPELQLYKKSTHNHEEEDDEESSDDDHDDDDMKYLHISWWTCFLSTTAVSWCIFLPLLCFPHSIAGTSKIRAEKNKQLPLFVSKLKNKKLGPRLKDLFSAVWGLLKNPLLMSQAFSKASESLASMGASEFMPIYLENQFLLSPSRATLITGLVLIPAWALGAFLGGLIICKLQITFRGLMRFTMATSAIAIAFLSLVIFVYCDAVAFAGISENYDGAGQLGNLTAPCNAHCGCSSSIYSSVCGRDEVEYFSPCFAGCAAVKHVYDGLVFYNCSCIKQGLGSSQGGNDFVDAVAGKCNSRCYKLPLFVAFMFCSITYSGLCAIPTTVTLFRAVPENLHSLALGVTFFILRIFGSIPGPLVFKNLAESSCIFWDASRCGFKRQCWFYNKTKMVYILVGICILCKVCTIFFTAIGYYTAKSLTEKKTEDIPLPEQTKKVTKTNQRIEEYLRERI